MTKLAWLLPLALLAGGNAPPPATTAPIAAPEQGNPDTAFQDVADDYIATLARISPVFATQLGDHSHDRELPDMSARGRAEEHAEYERLLAKLHAVDRTSISRDNQVDYLLLENALEYSLWQLDESQEWAWNPQYYNDTASYALYSLTTRDFAPWHDRLISAAARMEKIPGLLDEMRAQLDVARVPKVHAETVARQTAGIMEIVDGVLVPEAGALDRQERFRFDKAVTTLKDALKVHQKWLDEVLVPGAKGDFRLGAKLYDEKMRFALMSPLSRAELKERALRAKAATRAEMLALSRTVLSEKGQPISIMGPADEVEQRTIEAALALSYAKRPKREDLEQSARETLAEATAFTAAQGFVGMPDGEVQVITMPKFWQGNAVAYDDPPGALERDLPNYYAVSPIPEEWTDEQAESFLTEYNSYMLHDLSIHEGVPGHYLQLDHSNKDESLIRAVLGSGPFVEGWAVYAEGVMADEGYLDGDPLFKLTVLKMRLRSITNTLLDIGIHTEGMTRDEAMRLMMEGAFQQEREAAGKWVRANLSSVQLLSYFTGYTEHIDLREEARRRWGDDFTLRRYHDTVLSHGSPPTRFVRELMFDLAVE